jgi:hypothetical protein
MSGTSLALKIGSLVLGLGTYFILFKKVKGLKKYGITSLIYVLLVSLFLSCTSLFLYLRPGIGEITALIFAQLVIISLGTLHVLFASKLLPWYSDQGFGMQLIFLICILLFSYFFANLSFTFLVDTRVEMVWHLSSLWFLVPVMLNQTVEKLLEVPPKQFKKWHYPVGFTVEDPTDEEMENPVVISFVFKKTAESENATTFRAKAPQEMKLGTLFYFFINDYNNRHPESPVAFTDENKQPHAWIFFKQRSKLLQMKTALDPEDTILNCRIKENDVLVCNRELINEKISDHETTE